MPASRFRVIIQNGNKLYHPADISFNIRGGDIYYFPSEEILVGMGTIVPSGRIVNHLSFHKDGNTHAKDQLNKRYKGPGLLPTQQIGFQKLLIDKIGNLNDIPQVQSVQETDSILQLPGELSSAVAIKLSIVSGRLIIDRI